MKKCNTAVIGVTGLVGRELLSLMEKRNFPVGDLRLFGNKSAGERLLFKGESFEVEKLSKDKLNCTDIIFGCCDSDAAKGFLPIIKSSGAYFIDNSSLLRMEKDVPLIVPEINKGMLSRDKKLIANPNCSTIIVSLSLFPLHKALGLKNVEVTSFQAVSGAGKGALEEFYEEIRNYPPKYDEKPRFLKETIFGNVIPMIGSLNSDGYTEEEAKLQREMRKILSLPHLKASCTSVRVPVARCHSFSVRAEFYEKVSLSKVKSIWDSTPYIRQYFAYSFPSPVKCEGSLKVAVGRLRENSLSPNCISFFCCGDQLVRGACGNALLTGEYILKNFV